MFCTTCGEKIEPEDKFCARCGARVAPGTIGVVLAGESSSGVADRDPAGQPPVSRDSEAAVEIATVSLTPSPFYSAEPAPRKSGMPALLMLLAILMIAGAGAAYWMLRSSLSGSGTAARTNVDVAIRPMTAQVVTEGAFDFAASVSGADNLDVTWSIQEGEAGGRVVPRGAQAMGGKVSLLAVYIAPKAPGTYHVLVTSKADPKKSAAAEITVTLP